MFPRFVSSRLAVVRHSMLFFVFRFSGERDGPLHFLDSSKAPTPASRYGGVGYYSLYHPSNYSGSITPLSCYSHPFEMTHLESLREKLNRLTMRDKGFLSFEVDVSVFIVLHAHVNVSFFTRWSSIDRSNSFLVFSRWRRCDE